jgi:hypothetical protein
VCLPYLKHPLPCALSTRHSQRAGESRPQRDRQRLSGMDRWAASLAAATERLGTSCLLMWRRPLLVRIG